jgi:hypothetical protein
MSESIFISSVQKELAEERRAIRHASEIAGRGLCLAFRVDQRRASAVLPLQFAPQNQESKQES